MVYNNPLGSAHDQKPKSELMPESVPLLDRVFSFFIDYLILSPFVSFIMYFLFKDSLMYWKKNPTAPEVHLTVALLAVGYVFVFSFVQALFLAWNQATPGQYFLKIRFQFNHGSQLNLWRAFLRQLGFWFSFALLGLPWLTIFYHPLQQTFYDRLADGRLISLKKGNEYFFFEREAAYWRSVFATCLVFAVVMSGVYFSFKRNEVNYRSASYSKSKSEKFLCEELKTVADVHRLQFALAMNITGQLSDECLDREADFVLWKDVKPLTHLAYFAKSMTETSSELVQMYVEKSCLVTEDLGCVLSKAFTNHDFSNVVQALEKNEGILTDVLRYEVSLLQDNSEATPELRQKIEKYDSHRMVKKYLIGETMDSMGLVVNKRKLAQATDESESTRQTTSKLSTDTNTKPNSQQENKVRDWLSEL